MKKKTDLEKDNKRNSEAPAEILEIELKLAFELIPIQRVLAAFPSGTLSGPIWQRDEVFMRQPERALTPRVGDKLYRVRREKRGGAQRTLLALKTRGGGSLVARELETEVAKPEVAIAMASDLGFRPCVVVEKRRWSGSFDGFTVCVDDVVGLGVTVELEKLASGGADPEAVQADMLAAVRTWDLPRCERVHESYDRLILAASRQQDELAA